MSWSREALINSVRLWLWYLLLLLMSGNSWAAGEWVIAGGLDADSADGLAAGLFGDVAIGEETW
jgi:hypothetical protein